MRILLALFSLLASVRAGAECKLNALSLSRLRDSSQVQIEKVEFRERDALVFYSVTTDSQCANGMRVSFTIDQDQARALLPRPAVGPVVWLQVETPGQARLLGDAKLIAALKEIWNSKHSLDPVVGPSATLEFFALYAAEIEVKFTEFRDSYRHVCQPAFVGTWHCLENSEYVQIPNCVSSTATAEQLFATLDIQDPFIKDIDPSVSLSAVAGDSCDLSAHRRPFWLGFADDVLFRDERLFQETRPVVVRMKVGSVWPR